MTRRSRTRESGLVFAYYLGAAMRHTRNRTAASQDAIAADIGVTQQSIAGWETGASLPSMQNLLEYCRAIDMPMWRIIQADVAIIEADNAHLRGMRGKLFRPTLLLLASSIEGTPEDPDGDGAAGEPSPSASVNTA